MLFCLLQQDAVTLCSEIHGHISRLISNREIEFVLKRKKAKLENDAGSRFGRLRYDVMHISPCLTIQAIHLFQIFNIYCLLKIYFIPTPFSIAFDAIISPTLGGNTNGVLSFLLKKSTKNLAVFAG